nr:crosslink repair DNA glycosylase YcaQ family protein [Streptomyces sp. rh34]
MTAPAAEAELSPEEARAIVLAAALPAGGTPTVTAALAHLHIVQLDGISALARAHQLTLTARVPESTITTVDDSPNNSSLPIAFDYPAHALSLVPITDWPLWAFRRRAVRRRQWLWSSFSGPGNSSPPAAPAGNACSTSPSAAFPGGTSPTRNPTTCA